MNRRTGNSRAEAARVNLKQLLPSERLGSCPQRGQAKFEPLIKREESPLAKPPAGSSQPDIRGTAGDTARLQDRGRAGGVPVDAARPERGAQGTASLPGRRAGSG
jgi:hypothetical protein